MMIGLSFEDNFFRTALDIFYHTNIPEQVYKVVRKILKNPTGSDTKRYSGKKIGMIIRLDFRILNETWWQVQDKFFLLIRDKYTGHPFMYDEWHR